MTVLESQAGSGPLSATSHCVMEPGAVTSWASISSRPGALGRRVGRRIGCQGGRSSALASDVWVPRLRGAAAAVGRGPWDTGQQASGAGSPGIPGDADGAASPASARGGSAAETACVYVGERRPGFGAVAAARQVNHAPAPSARAGGVGVPGCQQPASSPGGGRATGGHQGTRRREGAKGRREEPSTPHARSPSRPGCEGDAELGTGGAGSRPRGWAPETTGPRDCGRPRPPAVNPFGFHGLLPLGVPLISTGFPSGARGIAPPPAPNPRRRWRGAVNASGLRLGSWRRVPEPLGIPRVTGRLPSSARGPFRSHLSLCQSGGAGGVPLEWQFLTGAGQSPHSEFPDASSCKPP